MPESDEELLRLMRVSEDCKDLNEFLEKFAFPCSLLQTEVGVQTAIYNLCEELKAQGLIYAEIRFAPQKSCDKGMTQEEAVLAAIKGMRRSSLRANIILCCMRGDMTPENIELNRETMRLARKYLGDGVCGADLAGAEALFPTRNYRELFRYASSLDVPFEIHAGEADGAESVRCAADFGAARIGHGVRSTEDASLMEMLAHENIPLLLCPTSNINTCVFSSVGDMPIRKFLEYGIPITINTDDPSIEGTDLRTEWRKVISTFQLTRGEVCQMMLNAVNAAFCSDDMKREIIKEMDSVDLNRWL